MKHNPFPIISKQEVIPLIHNGDTVASSTVVPMVPHVDTNEHSVQILVTEKLQDPRDHAP
jgi:acyl-CoA hydrolase